jgi:hypothetical protein
MMLNLIIHFWFAKIEHYTFCKQILEAPECSEEI